MAIWQVYFDLTTDNDHTFNQNLSLSDQSLLEISRYLPQQQSWSKNILQYGDIDGTCIEILYENSEISEISVRLHAGKITKEQCQAICEFANSNGLQISYKNKTFEASLQVIRTIILESDAFRFLSDPEKFLESLNSK